jgi:hypothetical protein
MAIPARRKQTRPLEEAGRPALRTFFRIAAAWDLSVEEQMTLLGLGSRSTYFKWKKEGTDRLSADLLERLSYVFGIYKSLHILLPDGALADGWLRTPNSGPLFGGKAPIERLMSGRVADLYVVRSYLDGERG